MAYLNIKMESNFNWDDIEVGNNRLNHSENFFAQKHVKHEKLDEIELVNEQLASAGLDDDADNTFTNLDFDTENKENASPIKKPQNPTIKIQINSPTVNTQVEPIPAKCTQLNTDAPAVDEETQELNVTAAPLTKPPANIALMWSTQKQLVSKKPIKQTTAKSMAPPPPPPPQAYEFKDLYEKKKQEALRRRSEEERKMRQFHSRPAPNFNAYHEQLDRKKVLHTVTVAVTPMVLKKSRETDEKRRKKLEEWKLKNQVPKFEHREPSVLKEEPFVPKKAPTVVQARPFNLRSERRLQDRKQFDAATQRANEERHKQVQNEEEERKKREEERVRELRKLATFKARPNPFKS